ncbi:chemotaxis protein CheW [Meridianimarinicoccus sp. RP-17]|uniref:chemotaxis protein CheW n=1 Tax=Meridianimarinicoccus zhengii TaxID=2056810 RepID=UPI000DAD5103|nr:chemotaxis protein CheW [Phycocomes zhengii]
MTELLADRKPADHDADRGSQERDNIADMFLTFSVADEDYGVTISVVTEIVGMQRIMSVPDVPKFIKGVINLRGKVIPLMDVRLRFGIAEKDYDERTVVIVLDLGDSPIGLIVDGVSEVLEIPADRIDKATSFRSSDRPGVVRGLGRIGERVAILLDEKVLVSDVDVALPHLATA